MVTAQLAPYVLLVVQLQIKEEWRSAMTTSGEQSVMTSGPTLMPELSAGNLNTHQLVSTLYVTNI